ncbi:cobalt ECF transporter T component CbiQ [Caproiciproducens faecalis]|uniref:Cobalt ECF transporter T component CbiQ n=1 Tax=Caproiciproducens faecalis TaxID=2820301 RepID=A0ABS7DJK5_9FIRM|nr:cobalt ECF transporter T component CbiQ [Caproiciproducens faecalis]MBW7571289.1 cobalt ECF transporter T component CbiQ [Caproiciproducens faecalis]
MHRNHEQITTDCYSYLSALGEWNTVYKVVFSVGALVTVIAADSVGISAVTLFFMMFLSVGVGKIPGRDYFRLMKVPAAFILLGGAAIVVQFGSGDGSLFRTGFFWTNLFITESSLSLGLHVTLKAFSAVSALFLMTLSTPMGEIISVFRKIRVPVLILELMHLIYRYIFILSETNQRQKDAAGSRLGYCDLTTSLRTFSGELANLLIMSMKKAETYYDAMEARGYEGNALFWEEKRPLTAKQLLYGGLYLAILAGAFCLVWRRG